MKVFWIFDYDAIVALSPLAGTLWAFGGAGVKPLRRFLLLVLLGLAACSMGVALWGALLSAGFLCGSSTLPYGDKILEKLEKQGLGSLYWWLVYAVGASYGLSLLPLFWAKHAWILMIVAPFLTGSIFCSGMRLSKLGVWWMPWKVVEILTGAAIGGLWSRAIYPH